MVVNVKGRGAVKYSNCTRFRTATQYGTKYHVGMTRFNQVCLIPTTSIFGSTREWPLKTVCVCTCLSYHNQTCCHSI